MQSIPLSARLKKRVHREVAFAQDVVVSEAFDAFPDTVLHGGTAIWRCYDGARFSEDVDAYLPGYSEEAGRRFRRGLAAKGVKELKFKATSSTIFGRFELGGAAVSFEGALRQPPSRVVRGYETLGGGRMMVAVLPAEGLLAEKAATYLHRRKVRDLYDVFFLLEKAEIDQAAAKSLQALSRGYEPPADAAQLKATILEGAVPTPEEMINGVRRWARRYT